MPELLDYSTPKPKRHPISDLVFAASSGMLIALMISVGVLTILAMAGIDGPSFRMDAGDFIVLFIACACGVGVVVGVIAGVRRWNKI